MGGQPHGIVLVRTEVSADAGAIHALHSASFPTAAEAELVDALRTAGRLSISLVAIEHDQVIGHVGFGPITVDGEPAGPGLAPVAVRIDCRRRGVAADLIRVGLERCRKAAKRLVVVLGEPRRRGRQRRRWRIS